VAGHLIVLEGPEGAGKTTQARRLAARLNAAGQPCTSAREPGGTSLGDEIRTILLDSARDMDPAAEALLFMASRAELIRAVVRPAMREGVTVVVDRFFLSTYAYQIVGRGLDESQVRAANALATGGIVPDLTLLLTVSPGQRRGRTTARGSTDRMEEAGERFHERVDAAFASFLDPAWQAVHPECGAIVGVDGLGSEEEVEGRVIQALNAHLPETFRAVPGFV
jgi:dTMP kinase